MVSILPLVFALCVIRLANGVNPFISLGDIKREAEAYNPPHYTERWLAYGIYANTVIDNDTSYGGGGGGSRNRGANTWLQNLVQKLADALPDETQAYGIFALPRILLVPVTLCLDIGYNCWFVGTVIYHLTGFKNVVN